MIRAFKHETVTGFAEAATVPVINGLTDFAHPTQVICDVLTMMEHKQPGKALGRFASPLWGVEPAV
jgi:putrescine carbamoyltransferase